MKRRARAEYDFRAQARAATLPNVVFEKPDDSAEVAEREALERELREHEEKRKLERAEAEERRIASALEQASRGMYAPVASQGAPLSSPVVLTPPPRPPAQAIRPRAVVHAPASSESSPFHKVFKGPPP